MITLLLVSAMVCILNLFGATIFDEQAIIFLALCVIGDIMLLKRNNKNNKKE